MTGDEFRKLRKAARLTQAQIGVRLGYSRQAVIHWEAGAHKIPDDALDKLVARSLAPNPEPEKPITPQSHPNLYQPSPVKGSFQRTVAHPHWWTQSYAVLRHVPEAMQHELRNIVTTAKDLERVWTPERAVVFLMVFLKKERAEAEDIARHAGFAIPISDPYLAAQKAFFDADPAATVDAFLATHPQFKDAEPLNPTDNAAGADQARQICSELDNAFDLTPTTKG